MSRPPKKPPREKDFTQRFLAGGFDEDEVQSHQAFNDRTKHAQQRKIEKTALLRAEVIRAAEEDAGVVVEALPIGEVIQVFSLFCEVAHTGGHRLCVVRKTLNRLSATQLVVGDLVHFRDVTAADSTHLAEAVIEQVLARKTVLTRADSFSGAQQQPIVANAQQMLIVVSLLHPEVKWGLVDRMLVAAKSGGLAPILCLNKTDLRASERGRLALEDAEAAMTHYATMDVRTLQTSVIENRGLDDLGGILKGKTTVLAGHSGVGKSSLITAIQPALDLRVGEVSAFNEKGRHTTTSARRYPLDGGGFVIDTPGVKMFGLWGVTAENLLDFFPDVAAETAPPWRAESYARIAESLNA